MNPRVGLILQARHGSTRLPGKALLPIVGRTLLQRCLDRLRVSGAGDVVLATTAAAEDDALAAVAQERGIAVYRGATDDVLGRYLAAALLHRVEIVIRATGDNPAVDIDAPRRLVQMLLATGADYACEDGLPYGGGVEAVTLSALTRAATLASRPEDREHVTTCIKARPDLFTVLRVLAPAALRRPDVRVTVDTPADLVFMRRVFARLRTGEPSLAAVIATADACLRSRAA